jgi:uroporphyrin-III C-methyltransferase
MTAPPNDHSKWSKASLLIFSDTLEPKAIAERLGLSESKSHQKGSLKGPRAPLPWKESLWCLQSPLGDERDMVEHLQWLLDVIEPKAEALKDLSKYCKKIIFFCGFSSSHGQGGFTLDPQLLVRLANLGIPFSLDLYPPDAYWSSLAEEITVTNDTAQPGVVYLVGAGPGDAGFLTLRALRLLQTTDIVLPDDLVSDEVLALAKSATRQQPPLIIPVGKRCGQPRITQAEIHALMLEHARARRSVVRLKSGDPLVFGRAGEEIAALTEAGIPFEIVPGITAAFAVAAALKTPLTDRSSASKLIFATAHHAAPRPDKPVRLELTPKWEGAFPKDATLVVYMPGRGFRQLADELIASGIDGATPCVAVSKATTAEERMLQSTLARIEDEAVGPAPVILLIGDAIRPA